jgi:hypothetical protein
MIVPQYRYLLPTYVVEHLIRSRDLVSGDSLVLPLFPLRKQHEFSFSINDAKTNHYNGRSQPR